MVRACGVRLGSLYALTFSRGPLPLIHPRRKKMNIPRIDKPVTEDTIMTIIVVDSFCDTGVDDVNGSADGDSDNDAEGRDEFMNDNIDGVDEGADDGLDVGDNDIEGREELLNDGLSEVDGYNEGGDDGMDEDDGLDVGDNDIEGRDDGMDEGAGVSFSHILTVLSLDPDTSRDASLLYDTDWTSSLCPVSVCSSPPATASHNFIVLS